MNRKRLRQRSVRLRIRAFFFVLCLLPSCEVFFEPVKPPINPNDPNNPVIAIAGFAASTIDATTIELSWNTVWADESTKPAGLIIVRKENEPPTNRFDGTIIDSSDTTSGLVLDDGTFEDADLAENTEYWYAAWTFDAAKENYTGPVYTEASTVFALQVLNFTATALDTTRIEVSWSVPLTDPPGGMILVRNDTASPSDSTDGDVLTVDLDDGQYIDTGLPPNTTRYYAVWTYAEEDGILTDAQNAVATTESVPVLSSFTAAANDSSSVAIAWTISGTAPAEIVIVRKTGSLPGSEADGTKLTGVVVAAGSHTDPAAAPNTICYYRAWTKDGYGNYAPATSSAGANTAIGSMQLAPDTEGYVDASDTYFDASGASYLRIGTNGSYLSLLDFDFSQIPSYALTYLSTANLYAKRISDYYGYSEAMTVVGRAIITSWSTTDSYLYSYLASDNANLSPTSASVSLLPGEWGSWDVTAAIQTWIQTAGIYGFRLAEEGGFFTYDGTYEDLGSGATSGRSYLSVEWNSGG